jgi:hypothetical protein
MADKTLGQVAYERYAALFAGNRTLLVWDALRPPVRARWETIATAVWQSGDDAAARAVDSALTLERQRVVLHMRALACNYPEDVFPPTSSSSDAIGGTAMRHAYRNAARAVEAGEHFDG